MDLAGVGLFGFLGVGFIFGVFFHERLVAREVLPFWHCVFVCEVPVHNVLLLVLLLGWGPRVLGVVEWYK